VLPLVALVQFWVYRRQRPLYLENLVFILHFQSFYFLVSAVALLLGAGIAAVAGSKDAVGQALEFAVYAWSIVYLFIAERRVYRARVTKIVLALLALAAAYTIFWALGTSVAGMYAFLRA